jgi:acyl carrier protein
MDVDREVLEILDDVLALDGRARHFTRGTPLLGAVPELDSMAAVSLITTLEERFGIVIDDGDIDGDTFATVGTLVDFVERRAGG